MHMLRHVTIVVTAFFLLFGAAAANTHETLDTGPGMVGADSAMYGLELAWDNAATSIGLKNAGTVAQERAAEAHEAAENGNYDAAQRAAENMASVAEKANADDVQGVEKAEAVLQRVIENAPSEAQQGLQTALTNVQNARNQAQQAADQAPDSGAENQSGADAGQDNRP